MVRYKTMVLSPKNFDERRQVYKYPHAISAAEVLRMAGVKSRATLSADYHDKLKAELDALVVELKSKTGKGKPKQEAETEPASGIARLEQLAQTIAALHYRIMVLEQENAALRSEAGTGKVEPLRRRDKRG